jgi:hypothetical protein
MSGRIRDVVLAIAALQAGACGRVGFGIENSDIGANDGGPMTDGSKLGDGAPAGPIRYAGSFAKQSSALASDTYLFTAAAVAAGDLVVIQVGCNATGGGTYAITAPNWDFEPLGAEFGATVKEIGARTFAAIAPDTAPMMFSVTAGQNCLLEIIGDEFGNVAPGGLTAAIDSHADAIGQASCSAQLTTVHANTVVWAACTGGLGLGAAEAGFTTTTATPDGDFGEYEQTADPGGTNETVTIAETSTSLMSVVAIAPAE